MRGMYAKLRQGLVQLALVHAQLCFCHLVCIPLHLQIMHKDFLLSQEFSLCFVIVIR